MDQGSRLVRARMAWILAFEQAGQPEVNAVLRELEKNPDEIIHWIDEIDHSSPLPHGYVMALRKRLCARGLLP